jgi:glucose/mannose-6-phosphate isomerase
VSLEPPFAAVDRADMLGRIAAIPLHIEEALERVATEPWPRPARPSAGHAAAPALLAVGGMGGSAIAADLTRGLYEDELPRPLLVARSYRWPACVGRDALALLSSYSGDTEETLALYDEAGARGVPRVALTTGGELGRRCRRDDVFAQSLPPGSPPRAALFSSWVALTALVHALGWCPDPAPGWRAAAARLRREDEPLAPQTPEERNPAKRLARALDGRRVILYAGVGPGEPVALRWRQQLNENAKVHAHAAVVPEANHNEIVGWERRDVAGAPIAVVILHDHEDSPRVRARLEWTADYARRQGAEVHVLEDAPGPRLERLASRVRFGDYVSVYLALLAGVDPTPIPSIQELKGRLSRPGGPSA